MYETLLKEAEQQGVYIYEKPLKPRTKGLQLDNVIWLNKTMSKVEKACTLAEEVAHYHTSVGDILDQSKLTNRKQELLARSKAYERLVPLSKIVQASKEGIHNHYELSYYLGVTESFLQDALKRYQERYGTSKEYKGYIIQFQPLNVFERR